MRHSLALLALVLGFQNCTAAASPLGHLGAKTAGGTPGAQDDRAQQERALERFRAYLAKKPFHEQGFARLVDAAVAQNGLGTLISDLEGRAADGALDAAGTVLLARLYGRVDRGPAALEQLAKLEGAPEAADPTFAAGLARLRGELRVTLGEVEAGLADLDAAAAALGSTPAPDAQAIESLHALRADAALRAGDRARGAAALADLAAVDPTSFDLALDVARRLALAGLLDEARARYGAALAIAGDDAPRRCRALAALGELAERAGDPAAALASYGEALGLLGRGHWLRRDLEARVLAVHTRQGTLADLERQLVAAIAARREDVDGRLQLARVQRARRDQVAARATLETAAADFPRDLAVGRELLDVLAALKDDDARVRELQRLIAEHEAELELYIELGQVLASSGRLAQARLQWQRTLENRLTDPGLCLRLAGLHTHHGLHAEALDLVERAIALEPQELGHYDELARALVRAGRRSEVSAVLDRAEAAAGDAPGQLEVLAQIAGAYRDQARASRALERALAAAPGDTRVLRALADHARRGGDTQRAVDLLREIAAGQGDAAASRDALHRIVRLSRSDLGALERRESERLAADPGDRTARLLCALAASERRRFEDTLTTLAPLLEGAGADETALLLAAAAHERLGDDAAAIARYEALIAAQPAQKARWLGELGRLHERLGDRAKAAESFEAALALAPDNPAAFREAARDFERLGEDRRARECLRQVLRLRPDDDEARLALADLLLAADAEEEPRGAELASELAEAAASSKDPALVARARAWRHARLDEAGEVGAEIGRLRAELAANPFDPKRPAELVDLFVREGEYDLALELLDELLAYRPADASLLEERAELLLDLERFDAALADYEALLRLPDTQRDALLAKTAEVQLRRGALDDADATLLQLDDRMKAVAVYRAGGLPDRARAVVEEELERSPEDRALIERLVSIHTERRDHAAAIAAFDRLVALDGPTPEAMLRRASLVHASGDRDGYRGAVTDAILAVEPAIGPSGDAVEGLPKGPKRAMRDELRREARGVFEVRDQLYQDQEWYLWQAVIGDAALAAPDREPIVTAGFGPLLSDERFADAATLLATCRARLDAGQVPVGESPRSYRRKLDSRAKQLERMDPVRAAARAAALEEEAATLTPERMNELARHYQEQGDLAALRELYERALERSPDDVRSRCALAALLLEDGDDEAAVPHLERLMTDRAITAGTDPLRANRKDRERLEKLAPEALAPTITEAHVTRHRHLSAAAGFDGQWSGTQRPRKDDVRAALAVALARVARVDEAREHARALEPTSPDHIARVALVADLYAAMDLQDDAARLRASLCATLEALATEPVLRRSARLEPSARAAMLEAALLAEGQGDTARAYELARRFGGRESARLCFARVADQAALRAALAQRWDVARTAAPTGGLDASTDAGVLALEAAVQQSDWALALPLARELAARAPTHPDFPVAAARLAARAGDVGAARATLESAIAAMIEEVRRTKVVPVPVSQQDFDEEVPESPFGLTPRVERAVEREAGEFLSELESVAAMVGPTLPSSDTWIPWSLEVELLALDWHASDWAAAAQRLDRLFTANTNASSWVTWELWGAVQGLPRTAATLPLLEAAYELQDTDGQRVLAYGAALEAAKRPADATRVYRRYARAAQSDDHWLKDVEAELARLDPAAAEVALSLEELEAKVAADPKSVKLRAELVEALLEAGEATRAADEALALETSAAHLPDVQRLCRDALMLAGREDEYFARLGRVAKEDPDIESRVIATVRAAGHALDKGDRATAEEILGATLDQVLGGQAYTSASFWLARGDRAAAIAALERTRAAIPSQAQWEREQVDELLRDLRAGDTCAAVSPEGAAARLAQFWKEAPPTTRIGADTWRELVALATDWRGEALAAAIAASAADLPTDRAELTRALGRRVAGDDAGAGVTLMALAVGPRGDRGLGLAAVDLARARGDFARVLALLGQLTARHAPSARRGVITDLGPLDERTALELELGALELELAGGPLSADAPAELDAPRAAVLARWRAALASQPELLVPLCHAAGFRDAAREALVAADARLATRPPHEREAAQTDRFLVAAARIDERHDGPAVALERLNAALRVKPEVALPAAAAARLALARELDRLGEVCDAALKRRAAAPDDVLAARAALALVAERDGRTAALELAATWPAGDESWGSTWRTLADVAGELALDAADESERTQLAATRRALLERWHDSGDRAFQWNDGSNDLAVLRASAGDVAGVRALVAEIDAETPWQLLRVAEALRARGFAELALEVLRETGSPRQPRTVDGQRARLVMRLLVELGRMDDAVATALDGLAADADQFLGSLTARERAALRDHAMFQAAMSDARAAASRATGRADRAAAWRRVVALERLALSDAADRLPALEALAAAAPDDPLTVQRLPSELLAAGRLDDAAAAVDRALLQHDRRVITGRATDSGDVQELRRLRGRIALRRVGPEAALAAWGDTLGARFSDENQWWHTIHNVNSSDRPTRPLLPAFAAEHGLRGFADAVGPEALTSEIARRDTWGWSRTVRALSDDGAHDRATAAALEAAKAGVQDAVELAAEVYGAADRLDALSTALERFAADEARESEARGEEARALLLGARGAVARLRGDMPAWFAAQRELLGSEPSDPAASEALADAALRAGALEDAYAHATRAATLRASRLFAPAAEPAPDEVVSWPRGGPVRFGYGEAPRGGEPGGLVAIGALGYAVMSDDDRGSAPPAELPRGRDLCAELARLLGRTEDAAAHEALRLRRYAAEASPTSERPEVRLARDYLRVGRPELDAAAEQLLSAERARAAAVSEPTAHAREQHATVLALLSTCAARRGDRAQEAALRAEAAALRGEEPPAPSAAELAVRTFDEGDLAAARAKIAEAEAAARLEGRWLGLSNDFVHVSAQAKAAAEGPEAARADLLRAVARFPEDPRAPATRALL